MHFHSRGIVGREVTTVQGAHPNLKCLGLPRPHFFARKTKKVLYYTLQPAVLHIKYSVVLINKCRNIFMSDNMTTFNL